MATDEVISNERMTMSVTNSSGEKVIIRHCYTNFTRKLVIFDIDSQNAKFLFHQISQTTGNVYPINRRPIDRDKPSRLGASKSVYEKDGLGMAPWAKHILQVGRVELPPKKRSTAKG